MNEILPRFYAYNALQYGIENEDFVMKNILNNI